MADDRVFRVGVTPDVINSQGDLDGEGLPSTTSSRRRVSRSIT